MLISGVRDVCVCVCVSSVNQKHDNIFAWNYYVNAQSSQGTHTIKVTLEIKIIF